MPGREEARDEFISNSDVSSDFGAFFLPGIGLHVAFFTQKSTDALETGAKTEDTLAWRSNPAGDILTFAVCDGVGGSYLGFVASQFLAERLVQALYDDAKLERSSSTLISQDLRTMMNDWTYEAQKRLDEQHVGRTVNPLLAEVLRSRQRDGSHTVFFCGCLDFRPDGKSVFAWMGNVMGQVFDTRGSQMLDLSQMLDDRERWTTTLGCLGSPHVEAIPTGQVRRVLVASDGLASQFGDLAMIKSKEAEAEYIATLSQKNYADDATLLSIWLPDGDVERWHDVSAFSLRPAIPAQELSAQGVAGAAGALAPLSHSSAVTQPNLTAEQLRDLEPPGAINANAPVSVAREGDRVSSVYYGKPVTIKSAKPAIRVLVGSGLLLLGIVLFGLIMVGPGQQNASQQTLALSTGTPKASPGVSTLAPGEAAVATVTGTRTATGKLTVTSPATPKAGVTPTLAPLTVITPAP